MASTSKTNATRTFALLSLLGATCAPGLLPAAFASAVRWDGDSQIGIPGDGRNWADASNWTVNGIDDLAPTDLAPGDNLSFGGGTIGTINLGQNRNATSLNFYNGFTLDSAGSSNLLTVASGLVSVFEDQKPVTINALLAGSNGLTVQGTDLQSILILSGSNTFSGNVNLSNCTLNIASDSNLGNSTNGLMLYNAAINVSRSIAMTRDVTCTGSSATVIVPAGMNFTLNGTMNASSGGLTLSGGGSLSLQGSASIDSLTDSTGRISVGGAPVLVVGTVNLGSGSLDLGSTDMILHSAGPVSINTLLAAGFNSGKWTGTGVISSAAAADTTRTRALGYLLNTSGNNQPMISSFDGQNVVATDTLVKYTYYGDANLDGKVDGSDYTRIDSGFLTHATGWYNGDFNYDGVVNGSDYTLIDNAFNNQSSTPSAEIASISSASIASQTTQALAVPEPTLCAPICFLAVSVLRRRRQFAATILDDSSAGN